MSVSHPDKAPSKGRGFTLLEMAVVLMVMGALALLATRTARPDEFALSDQLLLRAETALQAYVTANNRLPCADTDDDGYENCASVQRGTLPWATLGFEVGEFRGMSLSVAYSVHSEIAMPPTSSGGTGTGNGWGNGSNAGGRYEPLIAVLREQNQDANASAAQPYLAGDTASTAMGDCTFRSKNLAYSIRTVPKPAGAEPVCAQPVNGVRNTLRFMTLEGLQTYLLRISGGEA
ncbi:type II secretion system protein [Ideonella paludis]|uniref:Type II secretion system protein n=1 Tax=Ideonella paludis TaxID=1233411 RepID=A0ABS5E364_9BURK|nr:type II secretion system protein [Ideonella paludis]MBQ0937816.1 type II secretion system protein [Ideonella paludis]